MRKLGERSGVGTVVVRGEQLGEVTYHLEVYLHQNSKGGEGTFRGEMRVLFATFEQGGGTLIMEDGGEFEFVIRSLNTHGAAFLTNGEIPGY